jgi:2-keto-4-pentenoate hydratase/2-oxohepta-3-ene-1,7-dioic acid hydratase in catechol pathway
MYDRPTMRLVSFRHQGHDRVGVVVGDQVGDVSSVAPDMNALIAGGAQALEEARRAAESAAKTPLSQVQLLAPIPRPLKNVFCLGLNYREHVAEGAAAGVRSSADAPEWPVWFTKPATAVCGPYDDIVIDPSVSTQYDWEVELAVVIGKAAKHVPKERAYEYVHSYTIFNDFSVRDIQRRHGGQWFKGKSWDQGSPMGPWLITPDELGDPEKLQVTCRVNGAVKQDSNTAMMIFDIPTQIADITQVLTLEPGDIISTGTPSGVGFARKPPEFLKNGDVMETEIQNIGCLRNRIVER